MTDTAIIVRSEDFPLEPWKVEGENSEKIWPIPGSWTLAPDFFLRRGIRALLCCKNCGKAALITNAMGSMVNGVLELNAFQCRQCGHLCHARLQSWDTRKLFCIAYEAVGEDGAAIPNSDGELVRKEYTHAISRQEAFTCFVEVRKTLGRFRIVDVGEVIGFFGKETDKNQTDLTV